MFLTKFGVLNLFGQEEVSINFSERVTFITGQNGSGKSTLLNVIFDSLIIDPKKFGRPSTSKNRFWASKAEFREGLTVESLVLPIPRSDLQSESQIEALLGGKVYDLQSILNAKNQFDSESNYHHLTYLNLSDKHTGEWWGKRWYLNDNTNQGELDNIAKPNDGRPLGFLFQEDRQTLHNLENSSYDPEHSYWNIYKNSIDERFSYIRDVIQIRESQLNDRIVREVTNIKEKEGSPTFAHLLESSEFRDANSLLREIGAVEESLNKYLKATGKLVVRDDDNKITLAIDHGDEVDARPEAISWNLLSRGEKTLLYIFFAIYFYKDKVSVFLLDEPEISFHVTWQKDLIRDLSEIAPDNQFIVATHSPSLVMNGWMDNCLELNI